MSQLSTDLVSVGFPRSGNMFLNYCIYLSYKLEKPNMPRHTIVSVRKFERMLFPIRKPVDCLASQIFYDKELGYESTALNDYLVFMRKLQAYKDRLLVLPFEEFIKDTDYIRTAIKNKFNIDYLDTPSADEVKSQMQKDGRINNLPRDNQEELLKIKDTIVSDKKYEEIKKLYYSVF